MHAFGVVLIHILTGERIGKMGIAKIRQIDLSTTEDRKKSLRRALDPRLPNVDDTTVAEAMKLAAIAVLCFDDPTFFTLDKALDALRRL